MAYNKDLYTSADSALDAGIIYDQNQQMMQDEFNANVRDGDIVVGLADNLASSYNQFSTEEFIERTSGGTSTIADGDGHLVLIRGRYEHTGYVAPSADMTVTNATREEGEDEIAATIDVGTFLSQMGSTSGTFTFSYTSSWNYNPASYGITVVGTPVSGDEIEVVYQKEVRGTITQSDPQTFVSTGWNLYDHSKGYARALYYMDNCRFGISGTYTAVQISSTISGAKSTVTPDSNGTFGVPTDFNAYYIWVTGGNDTDTAVWMCWTDWTTQANGGVWQAYSESEIDFSEIMSEYFPNGLLAVGSYADEIDFSLKIATNKVGRLSYSTENLVTVQAMRTEYEYDQNYIYYGLETPIVSSIDLDNTYAAYDHGLEYFTGTELPVYTQTLYGVNLKNRLERDVVLRSGDTMTGDLSLIENSSVILRGKDYKIGDIPSSNSYQSNITLRDKNDATIGLLRSCILTTGNTGLQLLARRDITTVDPETEEESTTRIYNGVQFLIRSNGTRTIVFSEAAPWLSALGLGTSGELPITVGQGGTGRTTKLEACDNLGAPYFAGQGNALASGTNIDTALTIGKTYYSNSSTISSSLTGSPPFTGSGFKLLTMHGYSSYDYYAYQFAFGSGHIIKYRMSSGSGVWSNNWRQILTDKDTPTSTTTATDIMSAGSGFSITAAAYAQWGSVAMVYAKIKKTDAQATAATLTPATLVSDKRPIHVAAAVVYSSTIDFAYIQTGGGIKMYGTWAAGAEKEFSATYLLA